MVKKLTSEEFCSVAHRKAYHDEQEQLALARLIEDQTRLKPSRKPLNKPKEDEKAPESAEYLYQKVLPQTISNQPWELPSQLFFETGTATPLSSCQLIIPRDGMAAEEPSEEVIAQSGVLSVEDALAALSRIEPLPIAGTSASSIGVPHVQHVCTLAEPEAAIDLSMEANHPADPNFDAAPADILVQHFLPASKLRPWQHLPVEVMDFTRAAGAQLPFDLAMRFAPMTPGKPPAIQAFGEALEVGWVHLSASELVEPSGLLTEDSLEEIEVQWKVRESTVQSLSIESSPFALASFVPGLGQGSGPVCLETRIPTATSLAEPWEPAAQTLEAPPLPKVRAEESLQADAPPVFQSIAFVPPTADIVTFAGSIPRIFARPKASLPRTSELSPTGEISQTTPKALLMAQSRSAKFILSRPMGKCEPYQEQFQHPDSFLKSVQGKWAAANSLFSFNDPIPPKSRIASVRRSTLSVVAKTYRGSRQTGISVHPDPAIQPAKMREWMGPEKPSLYRPTAKLTIAPARSTHSALSALNHLSGAGYRLSWQAIQNRWQEAPNDLRWIAMAVPLVIGLIWFAKSPGAQDGAKGTISSMIPSVSGMMNTSFSGESFEELKHNIQRRAAVELTDDFRQGLGEWSGVGDWSRGWKYDPAGFIRPRQLALYTPSLGLEDYRMEFLGAIERKALSWVYRAADVKNYYAARLEVTRGGPLPTVELIRYAVIDGRVGPKKSIPLPMQGRTDTIYRVRMDVRGSDFVTTVQGQVVDVFSDNRLSRGGVGFFSEAGEDARLRWVEVSHQYDMLGRLCAYLVPYNVTNTNVRSAP